MSFRNVMVCVGVALGGLGAAQAQTGCVTTDTLNSGIAVTVKDGAVQSYRAKGRDVVAVIPNGTFTAELLLAGGVHVTRDHRTEHEPAPDVAEGEVMVGGNDGGTITTQYRFDGLPNPDKDWTGRVKIIRDQEGPSIGPQPTIKGDVGATVVFLAEETVTIAGCPYRIQPVETALILTAESRFAADGEVQDVASDEVGKVLLSRRQIWFADLGFAVITRERAADSGWGDDWGQGIIGLAAE